MPKGELFINSKDAYEEYGLSLSDGALSALMTPAPNKSLIESAYRKLPGKKVIPKDVVQDSREMNLEVHITAPDRSTFYQRYGDFCNELKKGVLEIRTSFQPTVYYRCIYLSCTQFSQFVQQMAKFSLKLSEPDPTNRDETDKNS